MSNFLEQGSGVGQDAAGSAQVIRIGGHGFLNGAVRGRFRPHDALARAGPPDAIDTGHQVMERFQQRK